MLLRSHGGGNCSGDGGAHEGVPDLHPTGYFCLVLLCFHARLFVDAV